jgi:hypothetical protein
VIEVEHGDAARDVMARGSPMDAQHCVHQAASVLQAGEFVVLDEKFEPALGTLARGDIDEAAGIADRAAVSIALKGLGPIEYPNPVSIAVSNSILGLEVVIAGLKHSPHLLLDPDSVVAMEAGHPSVEVEVQFARQKAKHCAAAVIEHGSFLSSRSIQSDPTTCSRQL